jgi:isocitrate dehydrogenase
VRVLDAAVAKAYGGAKKIHWLEVLAGEKANNTLGTWLPDEPCRPAATTWCRSRAR